MADLIVAGGTAVTPAGAQALDVAVSGGRISEVGPELPREGVPIIDATGLLVLPGVVDVHTHLRLPTPDEPNRFFQDTMAAAKGGTTTVLSFNNPGTGLGADGQRSPLRGLEEFRARTAGETAVDIGLNAVITSQQSGALSELPALIERGVPSFKAFMVYDFRLADGDLERAMRAAARHGGLPMVHCEEPVIIEPLVTAALERGETGCRHHARTRPTRAEAAATRKAIELARRAEAPLYVVHLSCAEALEAVAEAKARGEPVYAETCPHYLALTDTRYDDPDEAEVIKAVISPPLRSSADVEALWEGVRDGMIDVVGSDHVPDRMDGEKRVPAPPFPEISNGAPGIETLLSVVYSEGVARGRIRIERLVEVLSSAPAALFGLPSKGRLEVGADADLVLFDPAARRTLRQSRLHHTSDFTPYEGLEVSGEVVSTLLRGRPVDRSGRFLERLPFGTGS